MRFASLITATIVALGLTLGVAGAEDEESPEYTPFLGKGEHTVWDVTTTGNVTVQGFGNTYGYHAEPTDFGWYTNVWVESSYSILVFTCNYYEDEDRAVMSSRFLLTNGMVFATEQIAATTKIGDGDASDATYSRWADDNQNVASLTVSGFGLSRAADTFTVALGPFEFEYRIRGLFDVPAAANLVWCDDRD